MSTMKTEFPTTEGVLLLRQDGKTMAIHLTAVTATLEAIIFEPDIPHSGIYSIPPSTFDHYEVEAHGRADRLFLWTGPDPFAKREIRNHVEGIEA
jgi:hypothetical protein